MSRKPINETPMTQPQRRKRSDDLKRERGEERLTMWLSPEASKALNQITGGSKERGVIQAAVNNALLDFVRE